MKQNKAASLLSGRLAAIYENFLVRISVYALIGGAAALIDIAAFAFGVKLLKINHHIALVLGFCNGTFVNFLLCRTYLFKSRINISFNAVFRHFAASSSGLAVNWLVLTLLVDVLHFKYKVIAKIVATALAFLFNFTIINMLSNK